MSEEKKTYVVYSREHDQLGIHLGPKFMEFEEPTQIYYWPHHIDHGGFSVFLREEAFVADYAYVGEL